MLSILNTGAQWHMLPQGYSNYKTVHRRFQQWCREETLRKVLTDLANTLRDEGEIDESECFIDATFASAKGGGEEIGPTRRGKGVKIMAIVDRHGLPLSVSTYAANHHEVTLVQLSFEFYMIEAEPENLIGGRAYDSDELDKQLRREGVGDCAASLQSQTQDAGRASTASLRVPLDRGAFLCLDTMASPATGSLGVLPGQLPSASSSSRPSASSSGNFEILR